jgi:hypothetical protein
MSQGQYSGNAWSIGLPSIMLAVACSHSIAKVAALVMSSRSVAVPAQYSLSGETPIDLGRRAYAASPVALRVSVQ